MIPLFRVMRNETLIRRNLGAVWASGYVGEGTVVELFEQRLAAMLGLPTHPDGEPPILAVNSCSAALDLALHCAGVGPGDEVITTPLTCTATTGAIVNRGAQIVWADVERETGCIDHSSVYQRRTPRTKAVIAVDWGGRLCNYLGLRVATQAHDIPIIQDAAHSFLAKNEFYPDAHHGDYTCYSFGPIKHLTCGGYGGALITPTDQTRRARLLRWHGLDRRSSADFRCAQDIEEAGYRYHMTDDQAAVGLANLELVEGIVAKHRANAEWYDRALRGISGVLLPPPDPGSSWWFFDIRVTGDRGDFQRRLTEAGVMSSRVHASNTKHTAFKGGRGATPNADWYDAHHLAIPCGWWLSDQDRETVAEAVWLAATKGAVAYA